MTTQTYIDIIKIAQAAKKVFENALIAADDQKTNYYVLEAEKTYEAALKNIPIFQPE